MKHIVHCSMTGVALASFELKEAVMASCASMNWQAEWKSLITEHPFFSLTPNNCLRTARIKFRELVALGSDAEPEDNEAASVAFVAVLRNMGSIMRREPNGKQDSARILPAPATVITHGQQLLELAYWYVNAQSVKFQFPKLNIAKINSNTELMDIGAYLSICAEAKTKWTQAETARQVRNILADNDEPNFLMAAAKAEAAVIGGSAKRLPKPSLWNWLVAAIASDDQEYAASWKEAENEGKFFHAMFFTTDAGLKRYSIDDVDALEDILLRYAPLGTTPFFAFRKELDRMKRVIQQVSKSFTVDWVKLTVGHAGIKPATQGMTPEGALVASEADKQAAELAASPEPLRSAYTDQVSYIRAKASWQLARMRQDALAKATDRSQIF